MCNRKLLFSLRAAIADAIVAKETIRILLIFIMKVYPAKISDKDDCEQTKNLDDRLGGLGIERKRQERSHNFMAHLEEGKQNVE
jgi:hypothetical protein